MDQGQNLSKGVLSCQFGVFGLPVEIVKKAYRVPVPFLSTISLVLLNPYQWDCGTVDNSGFAVSVQCGSGNAPHIESSLLLADGVVEPSNLFVSHLDAEKVKWPAKTGQ